VPEPIAVLALVVVLVVPLVVIAQAELLVVVVARLVNGVHLAPLPVILVRPEPIILLEIVCLRVVPLVRLDIIAQVEPILILVEPERHRLRVAHHSLAAIMLVHNLSNISVNSKTPNEN
jgi:hypothetical protein